MHPVEHTLGKAVRRVKLRQLFKHRVQDHQLRESIPAVWAVLHVGEQLAPFLFVQFSVHEGRERGGIRFATFHLALISF